jgi:hypothetical protein
MADEIVADVAIEAEPIEAVEETVDTGTEAPAAGAEPGAGELEADAPVGTVWKDVKELLKDKPQLYRQVKQALHIAENVKKGLPDGLETAVKRMEAVNQLDDDPDDPEYVPGSRTFDEVISNTIAERTFWRDYDTAFQAGDPKVINQMIEANPGSFQKLIPAAMNRFAEINPEGHASYVCTSIDSYLNSQKIPLQIELLNMLLPESSQDPSTQRVIDAFKAIKGVFETIQQTAKQPIQPKEVQATPGGHPAPSGPDAEMSLRHDAWLPEIKQRSESFAVNEALKLAGKTRFTAAEVAKIQNFVRNEVNIRTKANDGYQKRVKGLLKANNKAAYTMTVESEHKKIISEAVKRIVPEVLSARPKPGPKPGQQQQPGAKSQAAVAGDEQYDLIAGPPRTMGLKVDFNRTTNALLASDRAYIVGRPKPVRWRRK